MPSDPMTYGNVPLPKSTSPVVVALLAIAALAMVVAVFVLIFFMVRPRGEKVGQTNLMDSNASIVVDAKPGDALSFRTDAAIRTPVLSLIDDEHRDREASELLRKSQLTVRATAPSGAERVATCALYKGRATSTSRTTGVFSRSGMLNDCTIRIDQAGRWTVRGSVVWTPTVQLISAALETRREAAASGS